MKKIITFGNNKAILELRGSIATIVIAKLQVNTPFPPEIAQLADRLNESELIDVRRIFPGRGKIDFIINADATNADIVNVVLECITCIYNTDTILSNERPETVV